MRLLRFWLTWREVALACALWSALALGGLTLRDKFDAVLLVWLPSGLVVALLHVTPARRWAGVALLFLPVQALTLHWAGLPVERACANSVASMAQGLLCTWLSQRALGGPRRIPRDAWQIAGVFGAAVFASIASALIAAPFRSDPSLSDTAWFFNANVLGIMTGAPVLLFVRQKLGVGAAVQRMVCDREFALVLALAAATAALVFAFPTIALMPVLIAGMVFATVRYGEPAPACIVMIYAAVATLLSLDGSSPEPAIDADPAATSVVRQGWMLVMLATVMPIAAVLNRRDELQDAMADRNALLTESVKMFGLAEDLAGIGRWRLDLRDGSQDWSGRMLEMNGLPRRLAPDPGDVRALLPEGGEALFGQIAANEMRERPYSFTYRIKPDHAPERILRISDLNEFDADGARIAVFAVTMDVTEQVRREEALDLARGRAVRLAAEAQKLANTDPLTGLPNRRCTLTRLESMVEHADRHSGALAVVMFDIDHFKAINDTHGHQTGDDVLVRVSELACAQVRSVDLVGRVGGEEFVWLLPGVDLRSAGMLAERLRVAIEAGSGEGGGCPPLPRRSGLPIAGKATMPNASSRGPTRRSTWRRKAGATGCGWRPDPC